jgi:hypothetical protein
MRTIEACTGPLANDDSNRLERFSPNLLQLVVMLVERSRDQAVERLREKTAEEIEEARLEMEECSTCPDCGWRTTETTEGS